MKQHIVTDGKDEWLTPDELIERMEKIKKEESGHFRTGKQILEKRIEKNEDRLKGI